MASALLFLLFSAGLSLLLWSVCHYKKIGFEAALGLFIFGIVISIPFLLAEYLAEHWKFYWIILLFISIESLIFWVENKVKYFHDLIQNSIKHLRITSFLLIGLGFTYGEITLAIFKSAMDFKEFMSVMPFRITYSLLAHTVLASAANIAQVGSLLAETFYETLLKLVSYYSRIAVVSLSHYIYVFSHEYHLFFTTAFLVLILMSFFYIKRHLDLKHTKSSA